MATIPLAIITNLLAINWSYFKDFCKYYMPEGEGRFQIIPIQKTNAVVINDAYNANPDSFNVSLDALNSMYEQREKILIIGDMLELGANGEKFHEDLLSEIELTKICRVITVGRLMFNLHNIIPDTIEHIHFSECESLIHEFKNVIQDKSVILVKGSHGVGLFRFVDVLINSCDSVFL